MPTYLAPRETAKLGPIGRYARSTRQTLLLPCASRCAPPAKQATLDISRAQTAQPAGTPMRMQSPAATAQQDLRTPMQTQGQCAKCALLGHMLAFRRHIACHALLANMITIWTHPQNVSTAQWDDTTALAPYATSVHSIASRALLARCQSQAVCVVLGTPPLSPVRARHVLPAQRERTRRP